MRIFPFYQYYDKNYIDTSLRLLRAHYSFSKHHFPRSVFCCLAHISCFSRDCDWEGPQKHHSFLFNIYIFLIFVYLSIHSSTSSSFAVLSVQMTLLFVFVVAYNRLYILRFTLSW